MNEYRGSVIHIYMPPPKVTHYLGGRRSVRAREPKVTVRLDNGHVIRGLPDDGYAEGDRIVLRGNLIKGGPITMSRETALAAP